MPNSVINVSRRMPLCEVRFDRTVKRHILNWMKKTSSRSHDKDEEQLTCLKTINYRTIFHTTIEISTKSPSGGKFHHRSPPPWAIKVKPSMQTLTDRFPLESIKLTKSLHNS